MEENKPINISSTARKDERKKDIFDFEYRILLRRGKGKIFTKKLDLNFLEINPLTPIPPDPKIAILKYSPRNPNIKKRSFSFFFDPLAVCTFPLPPPSLSLKRTRAHTFPNTHINKLALSLYIYTHIPSLFLSLSYTHTHPRSTLYGPLIRALIPFDSMLQSLQSFSATEYCNPVACLRYSD